MFTLRSAGRAVLATVLLATIVAVGPQSVSAAPVTCGGVVFQDYDADGERNENYSAVNDTGGSSTTQYSTELDPGVAGITVTVTTTTGAVETATTDNNGQWSVTVDDSQFPVRVQFSDLPSGWTTGPAGTDSGTTTQFISSASDCAAPLDGDGPAGNVGVVAPGSFCENTTHLITSCFLFGNVADHDTQAAVVKLQDGTQDDNSESNWASPGYEVTATLGQVGTVYGQGINPNNGDVYLGAMVKRHTRLAGNPTNIYKLTTSGAITTWFTSDTSATDPHTAEADATALGLSNPLDGWMYDFGAFDDVGKAGLGDVEVSPDGSTVYTIDLGRRELVAIAINNDGSAGTVTRTPITASALGVSCPASDVRPFGLGFDESSVLHIGAVCSAESTVPSPFTPITSAGPALGNTAGLDAWVHSFNGSAFTQITSVPLPTTTRGSSVGGGTDFSHQAEWRPWVDRMPYASANLPSYGNTYPQPILSDIDFDGDDMIVSVMDRWGHQTGANAFYEDWSNPTQPNAGFSSEQPISSGDILRGVKSGSTYSFPAADDDPRDFFYDGDFYQTSHLEVTIGSVAQIPGRPYVIANAFDPNPNSDTWQSGGLVWLDNSDGDHVNGVRLYNGRAAGIDVGTFEKAAGIGDLEANCGVASIQIGNRVWFDADADGIQDPGEDPMAGITIELINSSGLVMSTTTTDGNGRYYFENVPANTDLKVRVAQVNYDAGGVFAAGGTYAGRGSITTADAGSADDLDSDAMLMDGLPSISVNVSTSNHTFDIGFVIGVEIGNLVWLDSNNNGVRDSGEPAVSGVTVNLLATDGTNLGSKVTDSNGHYAFVGMTPGSYILEIPASMFGIGGPLAGYAPSTGSGTSTNPDDNVDNNSDATTASGAVRSGVITVTAGPEPTVEVDESPNGVTDPNSNLTVDFGFIRVSSSTLSSIGDYVWFDEDSDGVQDSDESPVAGVTATVYDADTNAAAGSDVSDNNGAWLVDALVPGDYYVIFTDPEGRGWTVVNVGGDATDSDALSDGRTGVYNLDPGEHDPTVDVGITPTPQQLAFTGPGGLNTATMLALWSLLVGGGLVLVSRRWGVSKEAPSVSAGED